MRLQIYVPEARVAETIAAIMDAGSTGSDDDGIIAISSIEAIYRIGDRLPVDPEKF